ncbi:MAG: dTDP-4-dehydrorhamnose reductase [Planctomycetota bacterium]
MRILLTGAGGQLGTEVLRVVRGFGHEVTALARSDLEVSDRASVDACLHRYGPQLVINAAAYTAVDAAEQDAARADATNHAGPAALAASCDKVGAALFHISTDYVFDGSQTRPYAVNDATCPLGVYGRSKWQGEVAVRERLAEHVIVRVSWLFGVAGKNFVRTILRLARERDELRVVADQHGCPTPARQLALFLLELATRYERVGALAWGTYHYCGQPATTWHDFATEIVARARTREPLRAARVTAITTAEFPTPARRPANSVLDCSETFRVFGVAAPDWRVELDRVLDELCS